MQINSRMVLAVTLGVLLALSAEARAEDILATELGLSMNEEAKACTSACALPTSDEELRKLLSPEQYRIVKQNGTERPFKNEFWDNHRPGIYVDVVSGDPLFSSTDKFDSGTGWPSFTKPLASGAVVEKVDASHGMVRTEVRSARADSHLGHVFEDGPAPTHLRYCINSGSLRFIPAEDLDKAGLAQYKKLFGRKAG